VGIIEEEDILRAMRKPDITTEIVQYTHRLEMVSLQESLVKVHYLLRQKGCGMVGVMEADGQLIGVIDEAGLAYFTRMNA
jgi:CBS domain-containing protein